MQAGWPSEWHNRVSGFLLAAFRRTKPAYEEHEAAKLDLKKLVPEDVKEAVGHGLRAKRSKAGAISFELLEVADASVK